MSESVEMYLVMTAMLRQDGQPVSLSVLADHLSISSASANEMCRKLEERGLVAYQPYKGVTLTEEGEAIAQRVLSRRRLWMAFLVESLGIAHDEADEIACRLEHVTSDKLVESLTTFLSRATSDRRSDRAVEERAGKSGEPMQSLTLLPPGARAQIAAIHADSGLQDLLLAQGLRPGVIIDVQVAGTHGAVIVQLGRQHLSLARPVAACIEVAPPDGRTPLLRCAQDMCRGFMVCLNAQSDHQEQALHCPRLECKDPVVPG